MRSRELAELLFRKTAQDEFTLKKLSPDPASPDEVLGFHAQQAIEKMLKAVLSLAEIRYRRTHDLVELIDLVCERRIPFPPELDDIRWLTPFASEFRYDDLPLEPEEPFDRAWALECVRETRAWAESMLRGETNAP